MSDAGDEALHRIPKARDVYLDTASIRRVPDDQRLPAPKAMTRAMRCGLLAALASLAACSSAPLASATADNSDDDCPPQFVIASASASSAYEGWPASNLVDGDELTSWFSADGDSAARGSTPFVTLSFNKPVALSRVSLLGNRDPSYPHGFSILTGKLELLDAAGAVLSSRALTATGATRDFDARFRERLTDVRTVRFTSLTDEGATNEYGDVALGEIRVE